MWKGYFCIVSLAVRPRGVLAQSALFVFHWIQLFIYAEKSSGSYAEPPPTVFISGTQEDAATIALLLRQLLRSADTGRANHSNWER